MRKYKNRHNIMFIHGAWSSRNSFNYLSNLLEKSEHPYIKDIIFFEYNPIKEELQFIINRAYKELNKDDTPTMVVGHSLGGLVALHVSDHPNSCHTITLSAPLSGIKIERMFQPFIYSRAPILAEIAPDAPLIRELHLKKYNKRVNCIITTEGYNPALLEKGDGVVTIHSQERWVPENAVMTYLPYNHHEVLQSDQVYSLIKKVLTNNSK